MLENDKKIFATQLDDYYNFLNENKKEVEDKTVGGITLPAKNMSLDLEEDLLHKSNKIKKRDKKTKEKS